VVDEVRRGISLVSGLETVECESLGWVGVVCENESMAAWMLRAIIAENVIARRERNVVFVPAGPRFTIYKEIKNIVVTIAKTTHFYRL
jgi:sirohydrochlorin cobaltochelatase